MKIKLAALFLALTMFTLTACTVDVTPQKVEPSDTSSADNIPTSSSADNISTSSGTDNISTLSGTDNISTLSNTEPSTQREFDMGDTVKVGNLQFTVTGTRTSDGGQFLQPKPGFEYFFIDVLVENISDKTQSVSSMMMFSLYDKDGYQCNIAMTDEAKGSVDGSIIAGKHIRGELAFEVEKDGEFELQIDPSILGLSGAFVINVSKTSSVTPSLPEKMDITTNVSLGSTMNVEGVVYTINSFRTSTGGDFIKPKQGYIYYLVDISVENNSDEVVPISSMMMFSLVDGYGYKQKMSIAAEAKGSVDGEVLPGKKLRGEIAYEVPTDATGLEIWASIPIGLDTAMFAVTVE